MTLPRTVEPEVYVSWGGSGDFDGEFDRVTPDVREGFTVTEGRDGAQQLNPPKIQEGEFPLRNERGKYSQENPSSPVYQRVIPGRPVLYEVAHGERRPYRSHTGYRDHVYYRGKSVWQFGRHVIREISQTTAIGNRNVRMDTIGYEVVLSRTPVTVPLMTAPRIDQCVSAILDAVSWPTDMRDISVSDTTLLYWWCDERDPWAALLELTVSEGPGTFYVDRDGVFRWENRNYRITQARSNTSQASFWDRQFGNRTRYRDHVLYRAHRLYRGRTSSLTLSDFQYDPGFRSVYNRATYTTRRRAAAGSVVVIWAYGADITLTAGQVRTLFVRPTDLFTDAVSPVAATDYTVSAGSATVTLTYTSGFLAIIRITAGGSGATITGMQLRAKSIAVVSETTVENSVDASLSIAAFSPIPGQSIPLTYPVQGWSEIDPVQAIAVCDSWVLRQQYPRPVVSFTVQNGDAENLEQILRRRPSDRITLIEANSGLSGDVWINAIDRRVQDAQGRTVTARYSCEQADSLTGAIWDDVTALWDGLSTLWGV
jgi:hypothetical protein